MASPNNWTTIESDPGVFTELMARFGVKNVQMEELYTLDDDTLEALKPVYGLIFLFKYQKESDNRPVAENAEGVFFAQQVINNACATQAILSILLNNSHIEVGEELRQFKEFTNDFSPEMKGLAISNSDLIRTAHNSFARPEPFLHEDKTASEDDDVFHFVSYVPVNGHLYELDGLKPGPIDLGTYSMDDESSWLSLARPAIMQRIERYSANEIRFNLMGVIKNRQTHLIEQRTSLEAQREKLTQTIKDDPEKGGDLKVTLFALEEQIELVNHQLAQVQERFEAWRIENIRRKHNYVPFIIEMLKTLADKGFLRELVEQARKDQAEQHRRQQEQ